MSVEIDTNDICFVTALGTNNGRSNHGQTDRKEQIFPEEEQMRSERRERKIQEIQSNLGHKLDTKWVAPLVTLPLVSQCHQPINKKRNLVNESLVNPFVKMSPS